MIVNNRYDRTSLERFLRKDISVEVLATKGKEDLSRIDRARVGRDPGRFQEELVEGSNVHLLKIENPDSGRGSCILFGLSVRAETFCAYARCASAPSCFP